MPTYLYECRECGTQAEEFRQVDQRNDAPECHGKPMYIVLCPTFVQADLPGYVSPASGKWIEGRSARRDDFARTNTRPWEGIDCERKEANKRRAEADAKLDRTLDAGIRKTISELPPSKRKALEGN